MNIAIVIPTQGNILQVPQKPRRNIVEGLEKTLSEISGKISKNIDKHKLGPDKLWKTRIKIYNLHITNCPISSKVSTINSKSPTPSSPIVWLKA